MYCCVLPTTRACMGACILTASADARGVFHGGLGTVAGRVTGT